LAVTEQSSALDAIDFFASVALRDPREAGEQHPSLSEIWLYQTPPIARFPNFIIVYAIEDDLGVVRMLNLYRI
jgi:hypothetical protein